MKKASTCATLPCAKVESCCLVGGCVQSRFPDQAHSKRGETLKENAPALNGTKPSKLTEKAKKRR